MKKIYILVFSIILFSCHSDRQSQSLNKNNVPIKKTIDVQINEEPFSLNHNDNIKYIMLESTENNFIDEISKLIFFNEYIAVLDNRGKTYLFNDDGSFVTEISKKGRGPGESLYTTDIFISHTDSSFYILDSGSPKLIIKDYKLNTLSEHIIPFYTFCFLKQETNEYWFFMNNQVNYPESSPNLIKTNSTLEILEHKLPIEFEDLGMTDYPSFSRIKENGAIFSLPLDYNIYCIDNDNLFRYKVSFGKHNLPKKMTNPLKQKFPNVKEKYEQHLETLNHIDNFNYVAHIISVLENDNYIYFQFEKKRKWYSALLNKNNMQINNGLVPTFFRRPMILNDNNQLISVLYPYLFNKAIEANDLFITNDLKNIIENDKDIKNPIIEIIQIEE